MATLCVDIRCLLIPILILLTKLACSQEIPAYYMYYRENGRSVNGSSTGNCNTSLCIEPAGVLVDTIVPTLNGLCESTWASQLLTLQTTASSINITFNFTSTSSNYVGDQKIEIVMFNCPQWGISAQTIRLKTANPTSESGTLLFVHNPTLVSCDSFVRVCLSKRVSSASSAIILQFDLGLDSTWIHLAEVTFSTDNITCPPDAILPPISTTDDGITTTTTTAATTASATTERQVSTPDIDSRMPVNDMTQPDDHPPSCYKVTIATSAISVFASVVLATSVFVIVQVILCKCQQKFKTGRLEIEHTEQWREHEYAEVNDTSDSVDECKYLEGGDHTYAVVKEEMAAKPETNINEAYGVCTKIA